MKIKLIIAGLMVFVSGCHGKHLAWISDAVNKPALADTQPKLVDEIGGVAITLDDGPDLAHTPIILDTLKKYNLRATFFVEGINLVGNSEAAKERRELLKREIVEGHIVGNHSYDHKLFTTLSPQKIDWEIDTTNTLINETAGYKPQLIRLPYGKSSKIVNQILKSKNLKPVFWDIDVREYEKDPKTHTFKTENEVLSSFIEQYTKLHNERGIKHLILILHDTKAITAKSLPLILDYLSKAEKVSK